MPRVLLIDDQPGRTAEVCARLKADGCMVVGVLPDAADLVARVRASAAEVIVCALDDPSRDTLAAMRALQRDEPRPVVMFVVQSDPERIGAAVDAGVAAYVIDGLSPCRVRPVVDVAVARFRADRQLRGELAEARAALADRKVIERAKGVLMQARGMTEEQAFRSLREMAMQQGKRLPEVAAGVITVVKLLRGSQKQPK